MNALNFFKKLTNFFKKKYLSFPTLSFLISSKNELIKKLYVNFWIFVSKRNISFKKYFFDQKDNEINKNKITFDLNYKIENLEEKCLDSLKQNGILILENALNKKEHNEIIEYFNKMSIKQGNNLRSNSSVMRYFEYFDLKKFELLKLVSDHFTKIVYGKVLNSQAEFYIHKSLKIPEDIEHGDNNLHIDRFLPNMKILYSPFEITSDGAPFSYALGSHKINNKYIQFVKNSKKFNESEENAKEFIKDKKEITCKANTIIIALTSGFHGRKSFLKKTDRKLIFLQYHKSFNKISLIFG